jgi:hypothetical protein
MSAVVEHIPTQPENAVANMMPVTPQAMLSTAVARGDTALAEKLMDLADRWEARNARKAFDAAIAAAKAEIPVIFKNREMNAGSGRTQYRYEDMAAIAKAVDPILSAHGLGYRFRTAGTATHLTVTCILFHEDGHSEENSLTGPNDTSGSKNAIQSIGSAQTYLQRYTLKAALGLAASADDDGTATGSVSDKIAPDQLAHLIALADDVGADKARFCRYLGVPSLADLPASKLAQAIDALNAKRAKS